MSNLIISLIAIALVAIVSTIAMMTLGDGFTDTNGKTNYAKLQNDVNQIAVATNLYMAENQGKSPANVQELVDQDYLKANPEGLVDTIEVDGAPVNVAWEFGFDNYVTQLIDSNERCAKINQAAGGSGEVEDIPSCSAEYDEKNPCCTYSGGEA